MQSSGWIIGLVLFAIFRALLINRRRALGDGSIAQESVLGVLFTVIVGAVMVFGLKPVAGALWKLNPVQDYGGVWAIIVAFPVTFGLGVLLYLPFATIVRAAMGSSRNEKENADPGTGLTKPSVQHDLSSPRAMSGAANTSSPEAPGPRTDGEEQPLPRRRKRSVIPRPELKGEERIKTHFAKYFALVLGGGMVALALGMALGPRRDLGTASGGLLFGAVLLFFAWTADRDLHRDPRRIKKWR